MCKILLAIALSLFCSILSAQQSLNNDAVVKLVKAGLSDDLIVSTINASPGTYDTSANGLIALKTAGVDDTVISAIVLKGAGATAPPAVVAAGSALPPGIDDVGAYYKDKTGNWLALMPEVVNFKTGGVMKSIASAGIVKGDVNGHIQGARAKLTLPCQSNSRSMFQKAPPLLSINFCDFIPTLTRASFVL